MVVALEAGRRNPLGDRLGGSLGTQVQGSQRSGAQQRLSEPSLSACHLPQGFPTHREKHNQGQECSWAIQSAEEAGVQAGSSGRFQGAIPFQHLLVASWKSPIFLTTLLHCNSLLYSASEREK